MPEYIPVPKDKLPSMIGHKVHLAWATIRTCHWTLVSIDGDTVTVCTNRGKYLTSKASDVMYTNRSQQGQKARRGIT